MYEKWRLKGPYSIMTILLLYMSKCKVILYTLYNLVDIILSQSNNIQWVYIYILREVWHSYL